MCAVSYPFHPRFTAVARKRPRSFCQNCRWQVTPKHAYTLDPMKSEWTDYATVQAVWEPIRKSDHTQLVGEQSAIVVSGQIAEPLWTNPGLKSGISVCEPISTLKKQRNKKKTKQNKKTNKRRRGKND